VEKTRSVITGHMLKTPTRVRGEFSFSGPWAILDWGPLLKVCDDWCHTNQH